MANGPSQSPFTDREKGVDNPSTKAAARPTAHVPAVSEDEKRAREISEALDKNRNDVQTIIRLAQKFQQEFLAAGKKRPLTRRVAATQLLRARLKLQEIARKSPTDRSGRLMQKTPFGPPALWSVPGANKHPHNVDEIPPFSPQNVREWEAAGDVDAAAKTAAPPKPAPPPAPKPPSPAQKPKTEEIIQIQIVKLPGMSLLTAQGTIPVIAAIIRLLSRQAISDATARLIASKIDLWEYVSYAYGESREYLTKVFESFQFGDPRTFRLQRRFLDDLKQKTSTPLYYPQRYIGTVYQNSVEYLPDYSGEERAWYVMRLLRITKKVRDPDSGYTPGQVVSSDGVVYVGEGAGAGRAERIYYAPDGRLFSVPQASWRDQQIEAFRQGVLGARGGVILGYGMVAVGAAAVAGPEIAAFAAESLGGLFASSSGLLDSLLYSRFAVWLSFNWQFATAGTIFAVNLGTKIVNFSPRQFVREFKQDPGGATKNLVVSIVETLHDAAEVYVSMPGGGHTPDSPEPSRPSTPRQPTTVVDEPAVVPTPRVSPSPAVPSDETPTQNPAVGQQSKSLTSGTTDLPTQDSEGGRVLKQMTGTGLQNRAATSGRPANDNRATNPSVDASNDQTAAVQQKPVVLKATGTGDVVPVDEHQGSGASGTTMTSGGSSKSGAGRPTQGSVTTTGHGGGSGADNSKAGAKAGSAADKSKKPNLKLVKDKDDRTARKTQSDETDDTRGIADRKIRPPIIRVQPGGPWKPVLPPTRPTFANRNASVADRLRFIEENEAATRRAGRPVFGDLQRKNFQKFRSQFEKGELTEQQILKDEKLKRRLSDWENLINKPLKERYMIELEAATKLKVLDVPISDNIGDQMADVYARTQNRQHAYSFVTQDRSGRKVQVDDFDFRTGNPIESKSIKDLVPPHLSAASREATIHDFQQQMQKQATVARDYQTRPFKWVVPPNVEQDLVDKAYGNLTKEDKKFISIPSKEGFPLDE